MPEPVAISGVARVRGLVVPRPMVLAAACVAAFALADHLADERREREKAEARADALLASIAAAPLPQPAPQRDPEVSVGPGYVESWRVTCDTSPGDNAVVPGGLAGEVLAFDCQAPQATETGATTMVAIGPSDVADPAFATRDSTVICGSGCDRSSANVNARQAYCRADTGTVDLFCWAIIAAKRPVGDDLPLEDGEVRVALGDIGSGGGGRYQGGAVVNPILIPNGTVGAPALALNSDADGTGTGLYRIGANNMGWASNGVLKFDVGPTDTTFTLAAGELIVQGSDIQFKDSGGTLRFFPAIYNSTPAFAGQQYAATHGGFVGVSVNSTRMGVRTDQAATVKVAAIGDTTDAATMGEVVRVFAEGFVTNGMPKTATCANNGSSFDARSPLAVGLALGGSLVHVLAVAAAFALSLALLRRLSFRAPPRRFLVATVALLAANVYLVSTAYVPALQLWHRDPSINAVVASLTYDPVSVYTYVDQQDPDGCEITLQETSAQLQAEVRFKVTANAGGVVKFMDSLNAVVASGDCDTTGIPVNGTAFCDYEDLSNDLYVCDCIAF